VKVTIVREQAIKLPAMKLDKPVLDDIGQAINDTIVDNILRQKQADGSNLRRNRPGTQEIKRKLGIPQLSLIFKDRRFIQRDSFEWRYEHDGLLVEPRTSELKDLVESVQEKGYTGWFGISDKGVKKIKSLVQEWIKEKFRVIR